MPFAMLRENESLDDFITRTYGTRSPEERKRIEQQLLRSNPVLRGTAAGREGGIVVLTDVAGVEATGDEGLGPDAVVRNLLEIARASTPVVAEALSSRVERQEARLEDTAKVLADAHVRRLTKDDPELKKRLDAVTSALAERQQGLRAAAKTHAEAVTQLAADLDALLGQAPRKDSTRPRKVTRGAQESRSADRPEGNEPERE